MTDVQWRRDATTSRAVRACWSLGVGTFFAAVTVIVFWRLFMLAGQAGPTSLVFSPVSGVDMSLSAVQVALVGLTVAIGTTVLALGVSRHSSARLRTIFERLSMTVPDERALERGLDAAVGTVIMLAVLATLIGAGRLVSEGGLLAVGAGPFTFVAALAVPLALVALVAASVLRSVGTIDSEKGYLYLHDPDERVDLEHIEAVAVTEVRQTAIVTLVYATPGGQYVPGPRRLILPADAAHELAALVGTRVRPPWRAKLGRA